MLVDGIDEGHGASIDGMLVKELLQIDLPHYLLLLYVPMHQPAIEPPGDAELPFVCIDELNSVDDVVVSLVQQFGAIQIVVVQSNIPLIVAHSHDTVRPVEMDEGDVIEMGLFRPLCDLLDEDRFLADIEGVDMLSGSNKQFKFII